MGNPSQTVSVISLQRLAALDLTIAAGGELRSGPLEAKLTSALETMAQRWHAGGELTAEQVLLDHPELAADPETAVRVVYEEYCLREELGRPVEADELYRRFPQWREELSVVLDCHRLLAAESGPPTFPIAGQRLGELQLLAELGRGALGRVFLATQPALSDRALVVKFTAPGGQEHLSLARLQHTHIVPLYLVQDFPEQNLRALCMPYLGGITWSNILHGFEKRPLVQRSGRQIVDALEEAQRQDSASLAIGGPAAGFLARSSYVEAVCWIGACLADALYYAHQRGLVHLDIKPSNILLAADGQPMLLDFHLACESQQLENKQIARLGGTPGYMSPEQRAAGEAIKRGEAIRERIDARCDIFALGVTLYESLAAQLPNADLNVARQKLRQANPQVSRGLEDVICKCLAPRASARYRDAGQMAADLRLHLASLPLRGVANRSLVERLQKWRRRKPYAMPLLAVGVAAALVVGTVGTLFYRDRVRLAEACFLQSQRELERKDFKSAIDDAEAAWNTLRWFPWQDDLKGKLQAQINAARQAKAAAALHELVDQLRFLDNQLISDKKLSAFAAGCRTIWQNRWALVAKEDDGEDLRRKASIAESLRDDLLDLAILSARLEVQLAAEANGSAARRQATRVLNEARELCGPSQLVDLALREYSTTGLPTDHGALVAALPEVRSPWEHYALGRWLTHHGAAADAQKHLSAAIDEAPNDFWLRYQQMRVCYELAKYDEALTSATVCIALEPEPRRAECYYNRALCEQALGHAAEARADLDRALKIKPESAAAWLARGVLSASEQHYAEATSDFEAALAHEGRRSEVYYQLARVEMAQHDSAKANEWVRKALDEDPTNAAASALLRQLNSSGR